MAKLTDEQKNSLAEWAAEGATLNDIQDRLKQTYGLVLTYFDTRLLVLESGVQLRDKKKEEAEKEAARAAQQVAEQVAAAGQSQTDSAAYGDEDGSADEDDSYDNQANFTGEDDFSTTGNNVSVELDSLAIPGTMVSGKVTFSDGIRAGWQFDQMGRLSLRDAPQGYQPSPADISSFQQQLQKLLR